MIDRRSFVVALAAGVAAIPVFGAVGAQGYDEPDDLYAALRDQPAEHLQFRGGAIRLVFADGAPGIERSRIRQWVRHAGEAMTAYFGRFPIPLYGLLVIAESGDRVGHATTFGYAGPVTRSRVGTGAGGGAFGGDWVMIHEMLHAALPDLPRRALWLQEGSSTWLEPVIRARAGLLPVTELWRQARLGMARGQTAADDGGLDGTKAWNRLYWGGAIFWLEAEIAIDRASRGRASLRDAIRAISRESGGNSSDWTPEQMMAAGDRATGTKALSLLYPRFAEHRVAVDLDATFADLGVSDGGFDDRAPLAALRRRITGG